MFLRILFVLFLALVPGCSILLAVIGAKRQAPPISPSIVPMVAAILAVFAVLCIVAAYALPHFVRRATKQDVTKRAADNFRAYVVRGALLESVAVYGFMVGILGGAWVLVAPFLAAAALTLIHAFPGKKALQGSSDAG